ncbi:hypothetical protein EJ02DRAFT_371345, partial [Clathrospora elynae]
MTMDEQNNTHSSAFSRISSLLKDTTRRKPHQSTTTTRNPSVTSLSFFPDSEGRNELGSAVAAESNHRRSSITNYADRMRHMFSTSTPTSSSARPGSRINALPIEVLQHIFAHLTFWDLLRSQRVCRQWRSFIPGHAPQLAEALYLKPSRGLQIYSCVPATFDLEFDIRVASVEEGVQPEGTRFSVGVRRELSMTRRCLGLIRTSREIVFHPVIMDVNVYLQRLGEEEGLGRCKEASWRGMLVSMPPLRELRFRHGRTRSVVKVLSVGEEGDGVTLGELFDAVDEW